MIFNSYLVEVTFAIALVLGVLWQGFKGISLGKGLDFGQILVVFLVYLLCFVPKTHVSVIDIYSDEVIEVANVPLGIGATGGIISKVSFEFSNKFTSAFSDVTTTNTNLLASLELLNHLKSDLALFVKEKEFNNISNTNFLDSWHNYFKECTAIAIDLGIISPPKIYHSYNLMDNVAFDSQSYGTRIFLSNTPEDLTCTQAHKLLVNYTQGSFYNSLISNLQANSLSNINNGNNNVINSNSIVINGNKSNYSFDYNKINEAIELIGQNNVNIQDYLINVVLLPIYEEAIAQKYLDERAFSSAVMLREAQEHKNTIYTLEQSLFFKSMRPFLTFFEALVFAITPFLPLIVGLGIAGLEKFLKFIAVLSWIELWMPLLAIVNLYIMQSAKQELALQNVPITSFSGILKLEQLTADYISLGGLLSSAVPIIAGMIVYGGGSALTSIVSRAKDAQSENLSLAHNSILGSSELIKNDALFSQSNALGITKSGAQLYSSDINLAQSFASSYSEAQGNLTAANNAFSKVVANQFLESSGQTISQSSLQSFGKSISSSSSRSHDLVNSLAKNISNSMGLSSTEEHSLRGAIGTILSGGDSDINLLSSLSLGNSNGNSNSEQVAKVSSALEGISKNTSLKSAFNESLAHDVKNGINTSFVKNTSDSNAATLSQSASELISAQEEVKFMENEQAQISGSFNLDGISLSQNIASNENLFNKAIELGNSSSKVQNRTQELMPIMSKYFPNKKQAYAMSVLTSLMEDKPSQAYSFMKEAAGLKWHANENLKNQNRLNTSKDLSSKSFNTLKDTTSSSILFDENFDISQVADSSNNHSNGNVHNKIMDNFNSNVQNLDSVYEDTNNNIEKAHLIQAILTPTHLSSVINNHDFESVKSAQKHAMELGLSSAQGALYASFAMNMEPSNAQLKKVQTELKMKLQE